MHKPINCPFLDLFFQFKFCLSSNLKAFSLTNKKNKKALFISNKLHKYYQFIIIHINGRNYYIKVKMVILLFFSFSMIFYFKKESCEKKCLISEKNRYFLSK